MTKDESGSAARPRSRRRLFVYVLAAALLLVVAAADLLLPVLVRPLLERSLADRLRQPVHIARLSWRPLAGEVNAEGISLGADGAHLSADRLSANIALRGLLRREVVFDHVIIDGPSATVALDEHYVPTLAGSSARIGAGAAALPPTPVRIGQLIIRHGDITVRLPLHGRTRDAKLEITDLAASEVVWTPSRRGLSLQAELDAALDGAPLHGEASVKLDDSQQQIEAKLDVSGVPVDRNGFDLPAALQTFTARLAVRAALELDSAAARRRLRLDVQADDPSLEGRPGTRLTAKRATLRQASIDFVRRRIDLGPIELQSPVLDIALTEVGPVLPFAGSPPLDSSGGRSWTFRSGPVDSRDGTVRVTRADAGAALTVASARWEGLGDAPGALTVQGGIDGGTVAITGALGIAPLSAELDVELDKLVLPPLARLAASLPLDLAKGSGGGAVHVHHGSDGWRLEGEAHVDDLQTRPPHADRAAQVMAVHQARAKFSLRPGASPWLDVASLQLSYPYVMAERTDSGVFPYGVFAAPREARPGSTDGRRPGTEIRLRRVEVDSGKVEFLDETFDPAYWTELTDLRARIDGVAFPQLTVDRFAVDGRHDAISPAEISGSVTSRGLEARAKADDLLLESLNPFVAGLLGYKATSGQLSLVARTEPEPPLLRATANVDLGSVGVVQTGTDLIQRESGVPFPIALGLIKGPSGNIELELQAAVDMKSRTVSIGSIVGQAIRSAIVGALTSPLRLLGSLFGLGGAPHAFAIDPIPFPAGGGSLDDAGWQRVAEIARILRSHDSLLLITMPQIAAADLDVVGGDGATALARQRGKAVRDALTSPAVGAPLAEARIVPSEWTAAVGAQATGKPGVYVELQAR